MLRVPGKTRLGANVRLVACTYRVTQYSTSVSVCVMCFPSSVVVVVGVLMCSATASSQWVCSVNVP